MAITTRHPQAASPLASGTIALVVASFAVVFGAAYYALEGRDSGSSAPAVVPNNAVEAVPSQGDFGPPWTLNTTNNSVAVESIPTQGDFGPPWTFNTTSNSVAGESIPSQGDFGPPWTFNTTSSTLGHTASASTADQSARVYLVESETHRQLMLHAMGEANSIRAHEGLPAIHAEYIVVEANGTVSFMEGMREANQIRYFEGLAAIEVSGLR